MRMILLISLTTLLPAFALTSESVAQTRLPLSIMVRELETPSGVGTAEPNLTRGRDGLVYLSWIQKSPDTSHTLFVSRFDSVGWAPARPVATGKNWFVNWADFPSLAVGEGGTMLASWLERSGEDTYAYDVKLAMSYNGGRTWESAITPHDDNTETEHGFVSLAALPDREFAVIWLDGREMAKPDGPMTLRYARVDSDGKLHDDELIDGKVCDCCQTSMVRCGDGSLAVVYRDRHDDEVRDIAVLRHTADGWTKPAPLHIDNWKIAGCPVNGPSLDSYERSVAASWFTMEGEDSARVYVAFSDDCGESFGSPTRVDLGASLGRVDICLVDQSRACVVWLQPDKGETKIMMRVVTPDGKTSNPISVGRTSADRESGFPRIAYTGERIIIAWTDPSAGPRVRAAQLVLE